MRARRQRRRRLRRRAPAHGRGYAVELGLFGRRDALNGDPALAAARYEGPVADAAALDPGGADCVIDALFGAGLARDIDGEAKAIIERINAFARGGGPVVAVDVPSGVDGETGAVRGVAVEASASVTFFRLKPGHLLLPGRDALRDDPARRHRHPRGALARIAPASLRQFARPVARGVAAPGRRIPQIRPRRGSCPIRTGAQDRRRAARGPRGAALGRGHRHAGEPARRGRRQRRAFDRGDGRAVRGRRRFEALLADERRRAIALGPGAGVGATLRKLVAAALTRPAERRAIVLDADALISFAGEAARLAALIARGGHEVALTPHEGEFARLFKGASGVRLEDDKLKRARAAARLMGAAVLIKGADTVVAAPDGRAAVGWDLPPCARHRRLRRRAGGLRRRPRRAGHAGLRSGLRRRLAARRLRPRARPRPDRRGPARGAARGLARVGIGWRWAGVCDSAPGCAFSME